MQTGGFQSHPLMRLTLVCTAVFLLGLWVTHWLFYFSKMGLDPQSVVAYYRGSEAQFTAPRTFQSMLEVTHVHLPMMGLVLLFLTHLLIFAPLPQGVRIFLIIFAFGTGLLNEGAGWLVRFVSPGFAMVKVVAFLAFQGMMAGLLVGLGWFLWMGAREGNLPQNDGEPVRRNHGAPGSHPHVR